VSAELVEGRLNPATSKPGDAVVVRLQEDLKVDNQVLVKKGTLITGIVRSAKRAEAGGKSSGPSMGQPAAQSAIQSMVQVDWRAPAVSGATSRSLNLALESVAYTNPLYAHQSHAGQEDSVASRPSRSERPIGGARLLVGGLAGGVVGGATPTTSSIGAATNSSQTSAGLAGGPSGQAALPASLQTASALQSDFGVSGPTLFTVGHGQAISSAGTSSSIDLYSHMSNDSILTSSNKDFEIASGAQMGFVVDSKR